MRRRLRPVRLSESARRPWRDSASASAGASARSAKGSAISASTSAVTGSAAEPYGETYWMDAAFIQAAGIPTVVLGPSGEGAHAVDEWVELASVEACTDVLVGAARELCA